MGGDPAAFTDWCGVSGYCGRILKKRPFPLPLRKQPPPPEAGMFEKRRFPLNERWRRPYRYPGKNRRITG